MYVLRVSLALLVEPILWLVLIEVYALTESATSAFEEIMRDGMGWLAEVIIILLSYWGIFFFNMINFQGIFFRAIAKHRMP